MCLIVLNQNHALLDFSKFFSMKLIPALLFIASLCNSSNEPVELTEGDFDEFLKGHAVFVKFYSPSCPHCVKLAPVWEKVAKIAPTYPQPFQVGT
jgi:thiol-disulfide isomerase/thioredoxin